MLVRLHIDEKRRRRSTEIVTDDLPHPVPGPADMSASITLQAALRDMSRVDRTVLVMRYYLDLSVAETARELAISEGAVRVRSSRAAARLRSLLGHDFIRDNDTTASKP